MSAAPAVEKASQRESGAQVYSWISRWVAVCASTGALSASETHQSRRPRSLQASLLESGDQTGGKCQVAGPLVSFTGFDLPSWAAT